MNPLLVPTTDIASFPGSLLLGGGSLGMRLRLMKGTTNPCGLNKDQETRQPARTAPLIHTHPPPCSTSDRLEASPQWGWSLFWWEIWRLPGLPSLWAPDQQSSQGATFNDTTVHWGKYIVVVLDRNRILFRRVFRVHHWVWRATALSFC